MKTRKLTKILIHISNRIVSTCIDFVALSLGSTNLFESFAQNKQTNKYIPGSKIRHSRSIKSGNALTIAYHGSFRRRPQ